MKKTVHFLKPIISLLILCIFTLNYSQAQEVLPHLVKKIEPSVVVILTYNKEGSPIGQGSGFFINKDGDIITNRHVLLGAYRAEVKTPNGKVYPITKIVAEDAEGDLIRASVSLKNASRKRSSRISVSPLSVSSSIPQVGEQVAVIGSPLGLERTVSEGIVSAVRQIPGFGKIIQITAPISPGSSGSPVVNMKGEVIGVATFQLIKGQNLNFAIPGERIARLKRGNGKTLKEWQMGKQKEWLSSAIGLYSTGLIFLWAGEYEKALPYFKKAAKKNPHYADTYFYIGYCNGKLGRHTEEIEALKQAIRIKPDYAEAHNNLGWAYGKLGRYTEAIEAYKQAIRIKPDFAEAHFNLGWTYLILGDRGSALDEYKILKDLDSDFANKLFNLIYK